MYRLSCDHFIGDGLIGRGTPIDSLRGRSGNVGGLKVTNIGPLPLIGDSSPFCRGGKILLMRARKKMCFFKFGINKMGGFRGTKHISFRRTQQAL